MQVVEKVLRKDTDEVMEEAKDFFEGEIGLSLRDEIEDCCLEFITNQGFVNVQVSERNGKTAVTLRSREYEREANRFIRNL
jgi:hypothetical protein